MILADDRLLVSRVGDAISAAAGYSTRFIGFLDSHSAAVVSDAARQYPYMRLYGGYEDAERVFAAFYAEFCEPEDCEYPIAAITVISRSSVTLSHRDYLGSLMSLGITRESVGDILCEAGRAVIFLASGIADYVIGQLDRVGGEGVKIERGYAAPLPQSGGFEEMRLTVASERLDCVVGALCSKSRSWASDAIESGIVAVNSIECSSVTRKLRAGDKLAVRGVGKFKIDDLSQTTRKGRLVLIAKKYI